MCLSISLHLFTVQKKCITVKAGKNVLSNHFFIKTSKSDLKFVNFGWNSLRLKIVFNRVPLNQPRIEKWWITTDLYLNRYSFQMINYNYLYPLISRCILCEQNDNLHRSCIFSEQLIGPQFIMAIQPSLVDRWSEEMHSAWTALFLNMAYIMKGSMAAEERFKVKKTATWTPITQPVQYIIIVVTAIIIIVITML